MNLLIYLTYVLLVATILSDKKPLPMLQAENSSKIDFEAYEEMRSACSWHCAAPIPSVTASSTLPPSGKLSYKADNIYDYDLHTAWVEGDSGDGVGQSVLFTFATGDVPQHTLACTGFKIANGYVKSLKAWKENSRLRRIKLYVNDSPFAFVKLNDFYGWQTIRFSPISLEPDQRLVIRFEILGVYRGSKFSDTALSEVEFFGTGDH